MWAGGMSSLSAFCKIVFGEFVFDSSYFIHDGRPIDYLLMNSKLFISKIAQLRTINASARDDFTTNC